MKQKDKLPEQPARGLTLVFTGSGKGKTSAAMGILARAGGWGKRVGVLQFIKSPGREYGEAATAARLNIPFHTGGKGFVRGNDEQEESRRAALDTWREAQGWIAGGEYDVLILDEITYLFHFDWLDVREFIAWLRENKPMEMHLVLTGRYAPAELIEYADLVTEMKEIKHPFREQKIPAQKGIDY